MVGGLYERLEGYQENLTRAQRIGIAILCCLLLCFLVATVVLAFSSGDGKAAPAPHHGGGGSPQPRVNNSAGWKRAAAYILQGLDETVKPCDDFYKFACNNNIKNVPENETQGAQIEYNAEFRRELVAFAKSNRSEPFPLDVLKSVLAGCIDFELFEEELDMESYVSSAMKEYGGFPLDRRTEFNETTFKPFSTLISTFIVSGDSTMGVFFVGSSKEPRVLQLLGFPPNNQTYNDIIKPFIKEKLANINVFKLLYSLFNVSFIENRKISAALHNVDALMRELSSVDANEPEETVLLRDFNTSDSELGDFYDSVRTRLTYRNLADETAVKFRRNAFYESMKIIQKYKKAMQTYLLMRFAEGYYFRLKHLNGGIWRSSKVKREEYCVNKLFLQEMESEKGFDFTSVQTYWMLAAHYMAKKANLTPEVAAYADRLLGDIRNRFRRRLAKLPWLSLSDKRKLGRRIRTVTPYVGLPQWLFNLTTLQQAFRGLSIKQGESFMRGTVVKTTEFYWKHIFYAQLLDEGGRSDFAFWTDSAIGNKPWLQWNAHYAQIKFLQLKFIFVDLPLINKPIMDPEYPLQVNYGLLGFILGHEFMHGFDRTSINRSGLRLSKNAVNHLSSDSDCLVQQYDKIYYTINDTKVYINGTFTLRENMADNGGVGLAYHSFMTYGPKEDQRMPGLEAYDSKQTFFLAMARVWCGHKTDEDLKRQIARDTHSPDKTRITQTLKNFPPFAAAFGCEPGAPMNPKPADRCSVW